MPTPSDRIAVESTDPAVDPGRTDLTDPNPPGAPSAVRRVLGHLARAAVLCWIGVVVLGIGVLRPDHLLVERVEFRGAVRADVAGLRHLVELRNGTTMWGADTVAMQHGAERHPWVAKATVYRAWPDTLVVDVEEHVPAALLSSGGLFYVDAAGRVFMEARGEDVDYPVVTGVDADLGLAHPDLPRIVVRDALALVAALGSRDLVSEGDVSEIAFSPARGFTVVLRRTLGARLVFGLEHHDLQLDRLSRLVDHGLDLTSPVLVDLAPQHLAIVRPLAPQAPGT